MQILGCFKANEFYKLVIIKYEIYLNAIRWLLGSAVKYIELYIVQSVLYRSQYIVTCITRY